MLGDLRKNGGLFALRTGIKHFKRPEVPSKFLGLQRHLLVVVIDASWALR